MILARLELVDHESGLFVEPREADRPLQDLEPATKTENEILGPRASTSQ